MTETPNVVQAIAEVARAMTAIGKARTSQGYKYRGIDDLYNAIHEPLATHGVVIVPTVTDHQIIDVTINAKPWAKHVITVQYDVYGPAGDRLTGVVVAEGLDNSDKGTGKALSYAYKSFVHQLLSVPTEDPAVDNEHVAAVVDHTPRAGPAPGRATVFPDPIDPRDMLVEQVAKLDEFLRGVFEFKIDDKGWPTIADIPADKIGAALATVATLAADSQITAAQLKKLGVLGTKMEASGLIPEEMEAYIFGITNSRGHSRKNLLKSEAGRIIDDWTVALADLP